MELTCLYHPTKEMKVTDDEKLFNSLLATGMWFKHPNEAKKKQLEIENEKQIRRRTKSKQNDSECKTETI